VESTRIVRKPEAEAALAEPALGCAHLLPEVRAARCEELLPRRLGKRHDGACRPLDDARSDRLGPARCETLAEKEVEASAVEDVAQGRRGHIALLRRAHRADLVRMPVTDEAQKPEGPDPVDVEGQDRDRRDEAWPRLWVGPEMTPPGLGPFQGPEHVAIALGKHMPLVRELGEGLHQAPRPARRGKRSKTARASSGKSSRSKRTSTA